MVDCVTVPAWTEQGFWAVGRVSGGQSGAVSTGQKKKKGHGETEYQISDCKLELIEN